MPCSHTVGRCGECRARRRSGEVAQDGPGCPTPRQRADGRVLTCVSRPLSEVVLDITGRGPAQDGMRAAASRRLTSSAQMVRAAPTVPRTSRSALV
ncbi:2Fe-2S iron-sulfur cluster-binding protein [Streptomyces sp. NPDC048291]|uniref:2Fe-2S iron-sulfur cluster-binding protein n=1 Tax=Streptomyces sp. NPDC048291 TaxID=3365530 RepID=UPI003711EBFE